MAKTTKLRRLEIAFGEDGEVAGAQATVEDFIDGERIGARTVGLDTGANPEYATALEQACGTAVVQALAAAEAAAAQRAEAQAERDALASALSAVEKEKQAALRQLELAERALKSTTGDSE